MEIYALLVKEGYEEKVAASLKHPSSQQYLSKKEDRKVLAIPGHVFVSLKYTRKTLSFLKNLPGIEGFFLQTRENQAIDEMKYYKMAAFKDKVSGKDASVEASGKSAKVLPNTAVYTKGSVTSVDIKFDSGDYKLEKISDGVRGLRPNIDYKIKNSICSILPAYLDRKRTGTSTLTFHMSGGENPTLSLEVKKGLARVRPTRVNYAAGSDVTPKLTLSLNGRRLLEISDGTNILKTNVHYTVQKNVIILQKSYLEHISTYLSGLEKDFITLKFKVDGGNSPSVAIRITEGEATVKPTGASYKMGSREPLSFTLKTNNNKFLGLQIEKEKVSESESTYKLTGENLTINPIYLESLGEKLLINGQESATITFVMEGKKSPEAKLHVKPEEKDPSLEKEAAKAKELPQETEETGENKETEETQEFSAAKTLRKLAPEQTSDFLTDEKKEPALTEEEKEESLDSFIRGEHPRDSDANIFGDGVLKERFDVIGFIKENLSKLPVALILVALLIFGGGLVYIYADYYTLKDTEPVIYYENDNEWSGWQGMDEIIRDGTLIIDRNIYYAPHAMYYFTLDQVPQENAAIKINTRIRGFTSRVYSVVTLFSPGGNVSLVTDKDYRLGLMSGPQGEITYSEKGVISSDLHDIYLFLDKENELINVYVDGNLVLRKERDFIVYPLNEVWIGSVWVGGSNDLGVGLGHDINSFILSDESIILANYTFAETLRQNLREKEWLWLLPLTSLLIIFAVIAWSIFNKIQAKKQN